tara:strand:+ start:328 stop:1053 length:726 start_codon:yes stop_codon:yes gene_type:complete
MKKIEENNSNLPLGAEHMSNAPWREGENEKKGKEAKEHNMDVIFSDNSEIAVLQDKSSGKKYIFNIYLLDESELEPYATREILGVEKDEDGQPEYDLGDWEIDSEVIENYINDNLEHLTIGKGLEDYENTQSDLVELDDDLKSELKTLARYQKDSNSYLKAIDSEGFEINESLRMIVRDIISESMAKDNIPLLKKALLKLKGVSDSQLEYNIEHGLPWDWKGSKEGFYEKMEPRRNYTGSN